MQVDRIRGHVRRLLGAVGMKIFLRMLAIPWLRARGLLGMPYSVRLAYRAAIVADQNRVCKVAFGRESTIALEHRNYALARRKWPQLATILPEIEPHEGTFASCLSMPRYRPAGAEDSLRHAEALYRLMRTCRTPGADSIGIEDSAELSLGIEVVAKLYGDSTSQFVRAHIQSYLTSAVYHLGFAHGDFHSGNILLDATGAPRLVDLDCVRFNGIQELDAMYFALEWEWSESGRLWQRTIADALRGSASGKCQEILGRFGVSPSFGFNVTCLTDRIGQETRNFGLDYARAILDPAVAAMLTARQGGTGEMP